MTLFNHAVSSNRNIDDEARAVNYTLLFDAATKSDHTWKLHTLNSAAQSEDTTFDKIVRDNLAHLHGFFNKITDIVESHSPRRLGIDPTKVDKFMQALVAYNFMRSKAYPLIQGIINIGLVTSPEPYEEKYKKLIAKCNAFVDTYPLKKKN